MNNNNDTQVHKFIGYQTNIKDLWNTINLRLPHRISHAPQPCEDEEQHEVIGSRRPEPQGDDDAQVNRGAEAEDGDATELSDEGSEAPTTQHVAYPVAYDGSAHHVHAETAWDVGLCRKRRLFFMFILFLICIYLSIYFLWGGGGRRGCYITLCWWWWC